MACEPDFLDFIEGYVIGPAIINLRGLDGSVPGDNCGALDSAAIAEISGDASRAEGVIADGGIKTSGLFAALIISHVIACVMGLPDKGRRILGRLGSCPSLDASA